MPKQPRSVSSLSASDTSCPSRVARDRILHAVRLVVVVDRLPDRFRLALRARVEAADHALQLGELLHHLGGEIALGELAPRARRASSPPSSPTSSTMRSVFSR